MRLSRQIKPISYLKAHAPEIVRELAAGGEPYVITVHGEAKAVLMDVVEYERMQETLAMMKIVAMGEKDLREGRTLPAEQAFRRVRETVAERRKNEG